MIFRELEHISNFLHIHNIHDTMPNIQENMTHFQQKSREANFKITKILEVADSGFKSAVVIAEEYKGNML